MYCYLVVWLALFVTNSLGFVASTLTQRSRVTRLWKEAKTAIGFESKDVSHVVSKPHLIFPGGGIFFYWQAGVVTYLREQGYNLGDVTLAGASAGALTATLTAADIEFYQATQLALDLAEEQGVWDRRAGLQGVWGNMIERWLDELLPDNVLDIIDKRLSLLVTPVPSFSKSRVSEFVDKTDLIRCNMASVHLPLFLDSKFTSMFRESPHIDGSFLATEKDYMPDDAPSSVIVLNWSSDPAMEGKALEFVSVISKESIWALLEQGKAFAQVMEQRGDFDCLETTNDTID